MSIRHPFFLPFTFLLIAAGLMVVAETLRDPFQPVFHGREGKDGDTVITLVPTATPVPRELSWQQKQKIATEEAMRLRSGLNSKGIMKFGAKLYVYIGDQWLTKNDSFTIERDGLKYRLVITELTKDNIQLEPVRIRPGTKKK